jgi:hypothetical protein
VELVPVRAAARQAKSDAHLIQKFTAALPKLTPRERKQILLQLQLVLDDG